MQHLTTHPRPRRLRGALVLASAAALAAMAAGLCLSGGPEPLAPAAAADVAAAAGEAAGHRADAADRWALRPTADRLSGWNAAAGTRLRYELELAMEMQLGEAGQQPAAPARVRVAGPAVATIVDRAGDEILVHWSFPDLAMAMADGRQAEAATAELASRLRAGFGVRMDARGRHVAFSFPADYRAEERGWARTLTGCFRFVLAGAGEEAWEEVEAESFGDCRVAYLRRSVAAGRHTVVRRKLACTPRGDTPAPALSGEAAATFTAEVGWLVAAQVDERTEWRGAAGMVEVRARHAGTLRLIAAEVVAQDGLPDLGGAWVPPLEPEPASDAMAKAREDRWTGRLRGVTLESLLDRIATLQAAGPDASRELLEAVRLLAALVARQPQAASAIGDRVRAGGLGEDLAAVLLASLGMAGSQDAQAVLVAVFEDGRLPEETRVAAAQSMFQLAAPRPDLVASVARSLAAKGALARLDGIAMLVLGAFAANGVGSPDGVPLAEQLFALEAQAQRSGCLEAWFHAVGNSASPRALEVATRHFASADESRRAGAVTAVRRVAQAFDVLAVRAEQDASALVRERAAMALGDRAEPRSGEVLARLATTDPSADVRRAAITGLAARLAARPELRAVLARVASSERDAELRELAARALQGA